MLVHGGAVHLGRAARTYLPPQGSGNKHLIPYKHLMDTATHQDLLLREQVPQLVHGGDQLLHGDVAVAVLIEELERALQNLLLVRHVAAEGGGDK